MQLAELRADFLQPAELAALARFPERARLPVILTIRRERDGGRWKGTEAQRLRLLEQGLAGGYAYLDLEADVGDEALAGAARAAGARVIRSLYDLQGTPPRLEEVLRRLAHHPTELPKAAVTPRSTRDLVALVRACRELAAMEKILIGTGEAGLFTRVLAGRLGSSLTYCSAVEAAPETGGLPANAPGHLGPRLLQELYRFERIGPDTLLCGVVGRPVAHSRSPEIHNRGYAALGLDAVYLPFLADDVREFVALAELLGVHGVSVTMPFKQSVIELLEERDPRIAAIGACNTVVRRPGGGWYGTNTDVEGFLAPLRRQAPRILEPASPATVLGAGGAARAVVAALVEVGLRPLVLNRSPERAAALAQAFDLPWGGLDREGCARMQDHRGLLVQATSVGMSPREDADPAPGYRFRGDELVYELIYQPAETAFLRRAQAAGCRTIGGFRMLLAQAEAQFRLFTGRGYPEGLYD